MITYLMTIAYDNNFRPSVILMKHFLTVLTFFKSNWNVRTSIIDYFVSFTLLSNFKLLSLCADFSLQSLRTSLLLYKMSAILGDYITTQQWSTLDPSIFYMQSWLLLICLCLPLQSSSKCRNLLPGRFQLFLYTFADSFQGCYKNRTEPGTRGYRCLSVLHFIIHYLMTVIYIITLNAVFVPFATILLKLVAVFL